MFVARTFSFAMHSAQARLVDATMALLCRRVRLAVRPMLGTNHGYKLFGLLSKFVDKMNKRREKSMASNKQKVNY